MQEFTDFINQRILWDVPAGQVLAAFVLLALSLFSKNVIRGVFSGVLKRKAAKSRFRWDEDLVELIPGPLGFIVQISIWYVVADLLELPTEPLNVRLVVQKGLEIAMGIGVIWLVFRIVDLMARIMNRVVVKTETKLDDQLIPLLRKSFKVFATLIISILIIQNLGLDVASLIASLGIGGLVLALAARDTVANFFGSLIVFTDQPFQIGDIVEVEGVEGVVEEVGFRTTRIRRFDKSLVVVPNQKFTSSSITNHSMRPRRRIKFSLGLTYDTTADQMRAFLTDLRQLLDQHPGLAPDSGTAVFESFGGSSLDILILCFANTVAWDAYMNIQEDILLQIMELVDRHGLEMAFPTRTVHVIGEPNAAD